MSVELRPLPGTLPLDQTVDCSCGPSLARPVLNYSRWSETQVHRCLACGNLGIAVPRGDEPRAAGPVGGANFFFAAAPEVVRWLAEWPVLLAAGAHNDQPVWVPGATRVRDTATLQALTEEETRRQLPHRPGQRLRAAGCPAPFGTPLPAPLSMYAAIAASLVRKPEDSPEVLLALADPTTPTSDIGVDLILTRPDRAELIGGWLTEPMGPEWIGGLAALRWLRPHEPAVYAALAVGLQRLPLSPFSEWPGHTAERGRVYYLLEVLRGAQPPRALIQPALAGLAKRIGRKDWELVRAIQLVLQ